MRPNVGLVGTKMTFIMWTKSVEMLIIFFCVPKKVIQFWSVMIMSKW